MQARPKIIAVIGPTSSGKSELAVQIAKKFNGEIISADSRQVYKELNIGSGKVTRKEMAGVRHHLLDVASPRHQFTVSQYQKLGKRAIKEILQKGKLPIVCGGTGLYVDALLYNYQFPSSPPDAKLRAKLDKLPIEVLFVRLKKLDPGRAATIDRHNPRRLIRALEIVLKTKQPIPKLKKEFSYDTLKIGIMWPKEILKQRIKLRLKQRLGQGMIEEVGRLNREGVSWQRLDNFGLEYRYISRCLRGLIGKEEMIAKLEKEIWWYAKRQMTWWRKDKNIKWAKDSSRSLIIAKKFLGR